MHLEIDLPDDIAAELNAVAGENAQQFAVGAIRQSLDHQRRVSVAIEPIREAYEASGMSEDQAVDLFETEKHAMRRGE